jgi:cell pole-organizing protein PopZ
MAQAAKAQEPSMEEILASIRRIIADDDTKPPARAAEPPKPAAAAPAPKPSPPPTPPKPAAPPPPEPDKPLSSEVDSLIAAADPPRPDVYDLTEDMAAAPRPDAGFRTIDGHSDVVFTETPPSPAPPPPASDDRLLSGAAFAAVDTAFGSLAQSVLVNNARTLEDLVRDMLRPMLKTWLDDNLPGLVERLVRAEIERVSRGRP